MTKENGSRKFKWFLLIWGGQTVSLIGTGLTSFALGVWVYETTGSVTQFTLAVTLVVLPGTLLAPLMGPLLDQWSRKTAMLIADLGAGLRTLALLALVLGGNLEVWHVFVAAAVRSVFEAVLLPSYTASVTLLVRKRQFGRANGMIQFGSAAAQTIAPGLAGLLMIRTGLEGLLVIDLITFGVSLGTLLAAKVPGTGVEGMRQAAQPLLRRVLFGWSYIRSRGGLLNILLFFSLLNFLVGAAFVLLTPLVLSFSGPEQLGMVLSIGSFSSLLGALVMSLWGGTRKKIHAILFLSPLLGVGLFVIGLQAHVVMIAAGVAAVFSIVPVITASSQAIWQARVEPEVQGRVFTTQRLIAQITAPVAYLLAGPLAERVFIPLLSDGGGLADSLGAVFGVGPGRGIGLIFALMGASLILVTVAASFSGRLRKVEEPMRPMEAAEAQARAGS